MVARICSEPGVTVNNDLGIEKKKLTINQTLFNFKEKEVNGKKKRNYKSSYLDLSPCSRACFAILAALVMSS